MLVLIAGITGSLGQRLARIAISRGLGVRGLGRNPDSLSPELAEQLESFVKSESYYDISALKQAIAGVDAIINAYAPNAILDLDGHLLLLRAAERASIKIFLASSWSRDRTNISFSEFEHYNNHIAFESQAATTSSISPVYIFTGLFADLLFTVYGPGRFEKRGDKARLQYWGDGNTDKYPWSTTEDAAEWTIDILLYGDGVQAGKGGFFKIRSAVTTIEELAAMYGKVYGTKVEVTREGNREDLEIELMRLRKEKGRARAIEHMSEAAALIASRGGWENKEVTILSQFKKPTTLEEHFREV
jgi:nucleoside-diphosphate-sugar epimerase